MSEEKEALRKLIMLISDLRAKDEERYEAHVNFMNETIKMIGAIESQMNKHWNTVLDTLKELNENISANLDSLLTGISPKGLRETSKSLKEIMDTMNKSVQSMNLEKVLSELKGLKGASLPPINPQTLSVGRQPEPITAGISINPPIVTKTSPTPSIPSPASIPETEVFGYVPGKKKEEKKKKKDEDEPHLIKPSDLFKK
jgi:vesicle coat complex subunit